MASGMSSGRKASLNNIVPLSAEGAHANANLRLTHRVCNIRRGAVGIAQTRML